MPTKKAVTKKPKAKKDKKNKSTSKGDIFDFIKDATKEPGPGGPTLGMNFLAELGKKGVKAKALYDLLISWGYEGVLPEEVAKLFDIYKTSSIVRDAMTQKAY